MFLLVDYDNVEPIHRRRGPSYIVDKLLSNIEPAHLAQTTRLYVRLYGGWYEGEKRTVPAGTLVAEVSAQFPRAFTFSVSGVQASTIVHVDVVSSLAIDPQFEYFRTFRRRPEEGYFSCSSPPFQGCADATACAITTVHGVISSGLCSGSGCQVQLSDVLLRPQQKLVDTMLAADLVFYAATTARWIAIATMDDDLWPAIHTALYLNKRVIHLSTKSGRKPSPTYKKASPLYSFHGF